MVAFADYYIIESVHGVRQRVSLQPLFDRRRSTRESLGQVGSETGADQPSSVVSMSDDSRATS